MAEEWTCPHGQRSGIRPLRLAYGTASAPMLGRDAHRDRHRDNGTDKLETNAFAAGYAAQSLLGRNNGDFLSVGSCITTISGQWLSSY